MRVLWLTNQLLPEHAATLGMGSLNIGGWMPALAELLSATGEVELGVATNVEGCRASHHIVNGTEYFAVPISLKNNDYAALPADLIEGYQRAVAAFLPDVIHIHGTEYFHGLLSGRKYLGVPTVISIQGIIDASKKHYFGALPMQELLFSRTLRDWVRLDGLIEQKREWHRRSRWEREIFASNRSFIGRTLWDKAHTCRMNPGASYHHCDEVLRPPFYHTCWELDGVARHTIYAPSSGYPLKGFHVLLKAVSLLRREFPDVTVRTPLGSFFPAATGKERLWRRLRSGGYANYLTGLIREEGLEQHVVSLGALDACGVASELAKAHAFALTSFIENSSNSLGEAMCIGTPAVASFVGGVPSMVRDEVSALCYPAGDAAVLAEQIRRIFLDAALARRLSAEARDAASLRHARDAISSAMLEIYSKEIAAQSR